VTSYHLTGRIALVLGWFSQKQLVRGLTFGAVK